MALFCVPVCIGRELRLRLLRSKSFSELVIVLEAERGPNDAPDAGQHVGDDVDVGLIPGHANVIVCVEEGHQSVPDREDGEDVVQHCCHMQHQVGGDQPQRDHHGQLGGVLRVAGGRKASHQPHQE